MPQLGGGQADAARPFEAGSKQPPLAQHPAVSPLGTESLSMSTDPMDLWNMVRRLETEILSLREDLEDQRTLNEQLCYQNEDLQDTIAMLRQNQTSATPPPFAAAAAPTPAAPGDLASAAAAAAASGIPFLAGPLGRPPLTSASGPQAGTLPVHGLRAAASGAPNVESTAAGARARPSDRSRSGQGQRGESQCSASNQSEVCAPLLPALSPSFPPSRP